MKYSDYAVIENKKSDAIERFKNTAGHAGIYKTLGNRWAVVFGDDICKADSNPYLKNIEKK